MPKEDNRKRVWVFVYVSASAYALGSAFHIPVPFHSPFYIIEKSKDLP